MKIIEGGDRNLNDEFLSKVQGSTGGDRSVGGKISKLQQELDYSIATLRPQHPETATSYGYLAMPTTTKVIITKLLSSKTKAKYVTSTLPLTRRGLLYSHLKIAERALRQVKASTPKYSHCTSCLSLTTVIVLKAQSSATSGRDAEKDKVNN